MVLPEIFRAMRTTVRCPTCRQLVAWDGNPHRPFCSARCQVVDLGAWADEQHRILGGAADEAASAPESDDDGNGSEGQAPRR